MYHGQKKNKKRSPQVYRRFNELGQGDRFTWPNKKTILIKKSDTNYIGPKNKDYPIPYTNPVVNILTQSK